LELVNTFFTEPNPPVFLGSLVCDDFLVESGEPKEKKKCPEKNVASKKPKKKSLWT